MASSVTKEILLHGAWYALEQAGQLLDSAVTLIEADKFSVATGVAMLGREELGRYKILRSLADKVGNGLNMSVDDVWNQCEDHEQKQKAAVLSTTMKPHRGTQLDNALEKRKHGMPSSDDWRNANTFLGDADDATRKRTSKDRHRLRMESFYVDIRDNGVSWSRPLDITPQDARKAVADAVNDYSVQRDRLINDPDYDSEMTSARKMMTPIPDLVPPRLPRG